MAKCREEEPDGQPVVQQLPVVANQPCVRVAAVNHQLLHQKLQVKRTWNRNCATDLDALSQEESVASFVGAHSDIQVLLHGKDVYSAQCRAQLYLEPVSSSSQGTRVLSLTFVDRMKLVQMIQDQSTTTQRWEKQLFFKFASQNKTG